MSSVLVIADDLDYAFAMQRNLECEGIHILVARDAYQSASVAAPAVVILDWRGGDFNSLISAVVSRHPQSWIQVTTPISDPHHRAALLDHGADDVLTKPFSVVELTAKVKAALRRTSRPSPTLIVIGRAEVSFRERTVWVAGNIMELPPRAFELLDALWSHRGQVVSRLTLLKEVWHHRGAVTTRTVDQHVFKLRRVLEWDPARPAVIVTVARIGYRMVTDMH